MHETSTPYELEIKEATNVSEAFLASTPAEKRLKKLLQEIETLEAEGKKLEAFQDEYVQRVRVEIIPLLDQMGKRCNEIIRYAFDEVTLRISKKADKKLAARATLEFIAMAAENGHEPPLTEAEMEQLRKINHRNSGKSVSDQELYGMIEEMFFGNLGDTKKGEGNAEEDGWNEPAPRRTKKENQKPLVSANTAAKGLYRDLAKEHHPDLHQDDQVKNEKTELMQKITKAYQENDLLTLLQVKGKLTQIDPQLIKQIEPLLKNKRDVLRQKWQAFCFQNQDIIAKFYRVDPQKADKNWKQDLKSLKKDQKEFEEMWKMMTGSQRGFMYWADQMLGFY